MLRASYGRRKFGKPSAISLLGTMTLPGWAKCRLGNQFLFVVICFILANGAKADFDQKQFPLLMPHIRPEKAETYLCTSVRIDPSQEYYITAFQPNGTMHTAHHILLYGCSEPGSTELVYNCGAMAEVQEGMPSAPVCRKGSQVIYAWAKNAPKLVLPEGVGFKVGGKTDVKYLVIQVHYLSVEAFQDGSTDDSGVFVTYTTEPQPKIAGVLMLGTGGRILPQTVEYMECACAIQEDKIIHPFAFRTHTHGFGRIVAGYKVTNNGYHMNWELIGKKDPQLPQMFYPVQNEMTISKGDVVAARCTMENTENRVIHVGSTKKDEMCNFYIMYWTFHRNPLEQKYCFTPGPPRYYWQLDFPSFPDDASVLAGRKYII